MLVKHLACIQQNNTLGNQLKKYTTEVFSKRILNFNFFHKNKITIYFLNCILYNKSITTDFHHQ